jgi:hypothetical protein
LILDHAQRHLLIHQHFLGLDARRLLLAHAPIIRNDRSTSSGGVRAMIMAAVEL